MKNDEIKRILVATVLSAAIIFGWQYYFGPINAVGKKSAPNVPASGIQVVTEKASAMAKTSPVPKAVASSEKKSFILENNGHRVVITNLLEIVDIYNPNEIFEFKDTVGHKLPLQIFHKENNQTVAISADLQREGPSKLEGSFLSADGSIVVELKENGKLGISLFSKSRPLNWGFALRSSPKELQNRQIRQFVYFNKDVERLTVGDVDKAATSVTWSGLDFNYHLLALTFSNPQKVILETSESSEMTTILQSPSREFNASIVFTKKRYSALKSLGDKLDLAIDFGVLGLLAVPILKGLQYSYEVFPNYGIGIIILTLLIRLLTFPFQWKSSKSMKKMQAIQPQVNKLKEKFKDDPQRLQKETMELFKRSGANPMGGCLPLLLQMPFFFAFYKVLYSAVELVGAPFYGWITDLSMKDPYYVLPVLMAIVMFLQQKLTPSPSTDPVQKKVMMLMPVVFGFIMKDFPAGLCLYIFVSTLFGIVQQLFVNKTVEV